MYVVYVLKDETGRLYKGMTNNLGRRLREHKRGKTQTTRKMANVIVVHTEEYDTFGEAHAREKYLKTAAGRRYLKKITGD